MPNPPVANPGVTERAPWRSAKRGVAGASCLLEMPTDPVISHVPPKSSSDPSTHSHGRLFQLPGGQQGGAQALARVMVRGWRSPTLGVHPQQGWHGCILAKTAGVAPLPISFARFCKWWGSTFSRAFWLPTPPIEASAHTHTHTHQHKQHNLQKLWPKKKIWRHTHTQNRTKATCKSTCLPPTRRAQWYHQIVWNHYFCSAKMRWTSNELSGNLQTKFITANLTLKHIYIYVCVMWGQCLDQFWGVHKSGSGLISV